MPYKRYTSPNALLIPILFLTIFLLSCSKSEEKIVAEFGDQHITLEEFRIAYLDIIKKPRTFDSPQLREKFLNELIDSRILAGEAERRGYAEDEKLHYKAQAYKNKALREVHFKEVIRPRFTLTEDDIQEAYIYTQEQRKISHLYSKTRRKIDSVYALLKQGKSFTEIAKDLFDDPSLAENGGDLGWIDWDELEYDLAMTAFRLPTDTFSTPVKSQFGYHIIKVTDYKKKPLITRQEYETYKDKAKTKLELMLGEKYAFAYIGNLFEKAEIRIYPGVATTIRSKLKDVFIRKPDPFNRMNETQLTGDEVRKVEKNLWVMREDVFVSINDKNYTVADFIGALNYIPYGIIYSSFKQAMNYVFRDFMITEEARALGLENSTEVMNKYTLYKEYLLQHELRQELLGKIQVTDQEIAEHFTHNNPKYKGAELSQVEEMIRKKLLREKKAEAIPRFVEQFVAGKSIKKYPQIIHDYYDSFLK